MGTGVHGGFGSTSGMQDTYKAKISSLPKNPDALTKQGWNETTPPGMKNNSSSRLFKDSETGLQVRFDKGQAGESGYKGKDHYHVLNPDATGKGDYYLDENGIPVPKNSKGSHIIP